MAVTFRETVDVALAKLTRFPGNARRGDVDRIRESIRRHGQYRALVVRDTGESLVILAGNHTHDAIKAEGHPSARCEIIECSDDEARRINLADNRLGELGSNDLDALAELLSYLDDDYEGTGYTAEDVEALITPPEDLPQMNGDPDDVPEPPAQPRSVSGDLWHLGPHRLLCGDSTNPDDVDRVLEDLGTPGVVYTDPPYGIKAVPKDGGVSRGKLAKAAEYMPVAGDDTTEVAGDTFRLLHTAYPTARHVWWGGNHYAASAGLPDTSCWLVWDKQNAGNDFADCELAWTNHTGAVRMLSHMWNGMLRASERDTKRVHPTQKPVALGEWAFGVVDPDNSRRIVLDVFGGSGSTLLAAHASKRTAALIEMEPAYVDVICRRFQQLTGIKPVHAESGAVVDFTTEPANQ